MGNNIDVGPSPLYYFSEAIVNVIEFILHSLFTERVDHERGGA